MHVPERVKHGTRELGGGAGGGHLKTRLNQVETRTGEDRSDGGPVSTTQAEL